MINKEFIEKIPVSDIQRKLQINYPDALRFKENLIKALPLLALDKPAEMKLISDEIRYKVTEDICKKYNIPWADMCDGKLPVSKLEPFVIDIFDGGCKAQLALDQKAKGG